MCKLPGPEATTTMGLGLQAKDQFSYWVWSESAGMAVARLEDIDVFMFHLLLIKIEEDKKLFFENWPRNFFSRQPLRTLRSFHCLFQTGLMPDNDSHFWPLGQGGNVQTSRPWSDHSKQMASFHIGSGSSLQAWQWPGLRILMHLCFVSFSPSRQNLEVNKNTFFYYHCIGWKYDSVPVWWGHMWQYEIVTLWQCDSVTARPCGSVAVWPCDRVAVWQCDSVTIWQCDVRQCDRGPIVAARTRRPKLHSLSSAYVHLQRIPKWSQNHECLW